MTKASAENNELNESVTEPIARAAYLAMPAPRSLNRVKLEMDRRYTKVPSIQTLKNWSRKNSWQRLAREHDAAVARGAAAIVVKKQARTAAERAEWLTDHGEKLIEEGIRLAREGDPAALVRAGIEALKYAEVLQGGVSDRHGVVTPDDEKAAADRAEEARQAVLALITKVRGAPKLTNGHAGDDTEH